MDDVDDEVVTGVTLVAQSVYEGIVHPEELGVLARFQAGPDPVAPTAILVRGHPH